MLTTPAQINSNVIKLRDKIGVQTDPVYIEVANTLGHKIDDCFLNVKRKVAREGGTIVYGWMVWEDPKRLIEGVFHAIWESPDGRLSDITPKQDGEAKIVFIPDPTATYDARPVDNVRIALGNDPQIAADIRYHEGMSQLRMKYNSDGEAAIPGFEIQKLMAEVFGGLTPASSRPTMQLSSGIGRNDPCPCGSRKKFKKCCG